MRSRSDSLPQQFRLLPTCSFSILRTNPNPLPWSVGLCMIWSVSISCLTSLPSPRISQALPGRRAFALAMLCLDCFSPPRTILAPCHSSVLSFSIAFSGRSSGPYLKLHACVCVRACSVAQWCPTLFDPMDYSPPGSSVHRILQTRILEWVAIFYSRGSSRPRDWTQVSRVSCIGRWILYHCTT